MARRSINLGGLALALVASFAIADRACDCRIAAGLCTRCRASLPQVLPWLPQRAGSTGQPRPRKPCTNAARRRARCHRRRRQCGKEPADPRARKSGSSRRCRPKGNKGPRHGRNRCSESVDPSRGARVESKFDDAGRNRHAENRASGQSREIPSRLSPILPMDVGCRRAVRLVSKFSVLPRRPIARSASVARRSRESPGNVNSVGFSADGSIAVRGGRRAGTIWRVVAVEHVGLDAGGPTLRGHRDALLGAAIEPGRQNRRDGQLRPDAALWDVATGKELRVLKGHNGAVFDVAFDPIGPSAGKCQRRPHGQVVGRRHGRAARYVQSADEGPVRRRLQPRWHKRSSREGSTAASASGGSAPRPKREPMNSSSRSSRMTGRSCGWPSRATAGGSPPLPKTARSRFGTRPVSRRSRNSPDQSDWTTALGHRPTATTLAAGRMDGSLSISSFARVLAVDDRPGDTARLREAARDSIHRSRPRSRRRAEVEPNDSPAHPMDLMLPARVNGVLSLGKDGRSRRRFLPVPTRKPARHGSSRPRRPARIRPPTRGSTFCTPTVRPWCGACCEPSAIRPSRFARSIRGRAECAVENWQEMDLDQFLYMSGEVCRLFRAPRGPDSEYGLYAQNGAQRCYFDTSAREPHAQRADLHRRAVRPRHAAGRQRAADFSRLSIRTMTTARESWATIRG